jgi:hypothetical protein
LDAGLEKQTELTDKRAFWDWLIFCGRSAAIQTSKRAARERRTDRKRLENIYAEQLPNGDATDTAAQLEKYYSEDDAAIRFRSKVEEAESAEKISPFFFNLIKLNQKQSNVERACTPEFPNGTNSREEAMEALESHFSKTFGDTDPKVQVDDIWWDGLQSIDDATKTKLDSPITL